jgi:uncharacterized protein GlcG (DUF336 family)
MFNTKKAVATSALALVMMTGGWSAHAQVSESGYVLPMNLALQGALEAVQTCKANGYDVTATVVDVSGTPQVVLRGDHATIHTKDSSYRKAYTVVTMGPIFHFDVTSKFFDVLAKYPPIGAQGLVSAPNVVALPGGAAVKLRDEIVAGIGVGGSPGGDKDEVCAKAGVAKVESLMSH